MINETTTARIDALSTRYRKLSRDHHQALTEIAMAEVPEAVHQSNAIENSTLTLASGSAHRDLRRRSRAVPSG